MRSNSFEITGAWVGDDRDADRAVILADSAEAMVTEFNGLTPGCVTIMIGHPQEPAGGKLALWIDLDRGTALGISDKLLKAIAAGESGRAAGTAVAVEAWDAAGESCLASRNVGFEVGYGFGADDLAKGKCSIEMDRKTTGRAAQDEILVTFDGANARILAELLRIMPFR